MYQHHIMLKTREPLCGLDALEWYAMVKEYAPENTVYPYQYNGNSVAMEYGVFHEEEFEHGYAIPLTRDLTGIETMFIVNAWEVCFPDDFDIEVSNSYEAKGLGDFQNTIEYDIDEDLKETAINAMSKWDHNRWVDQKLSEGWRWGSYFSSQQKTHPALRDWDNLPESHRRTRPIENQEIYDWLKSANIFK